MFTPQEYQFLADIIEAGETTKVSPEVADIVVSALRIAAQSGDPMLKDGMEETIPF